MDTKISFRIRKGSKWSGADVLLLVNLPKTVQEGQIVYSAAQPFNSDGTTQEIGNGWRLPTDLFTGFKPNQFTAFNEVVTYHEFDVQFSLAGAFFV
ncbi:MAG: hypothetical protein ACKO96_10435 [Flammeovirgaceae bacterium]